MKRSPAFVNPIVISREEVFEYELVLLHVLSFDLTVDHPHKNLGKFISDGIFDPSIFKRSDINPQDMNRSAEAIAALTWQLLTEILLRSTIILEYNSMQVTVAALKFCANEAMVPIEFLSSSINEMSYPQDLYLQIAKYGNKEKTT